MVVGQNGKEFFLGSNLINQKTNLAISSPPPMYGAVKQSPEGNNGGSSSTRIHHDGQMKRTTTSRGTLENPIEKHTFSSEFVKSAVYGAMDGVLTSFAVISGGEGGSLAPNVVIVLGLCGLVANAMSMGMGDAVSSLSYDEHVANERLREEWEFENFPEGEIEEMVELYESRGLPKEKAEIVVTTMAKYKELFLDIMVAQELGLKMCKPEDKNNYWKGGLVTMLSFLVFGLCPLLTFVLCLDYCPASWVKEGHEGKPLFYVSAIATLCTLFVLGVAKSKFTCAVWWRSGIEFCILGGLCATVAYATGSIVSELVGSTPPL